MSTHELPPIGLWHQDPGSTRLADFEAFYNTERHRLVWKIRAAFGPNIVDGTDAEDIAQQAFLIVFERWPRVGYLKYPRAYTDTVAFNIARRARTRNQHSVPLPDSQLDAVLAPQPGPEANLARLTVLQAVKRLAPRQAQVVMLQLDGLEDSDIAAALDITTDAVRSHRRHAKIALRHPTAATHD